MSSNLFLNMNPLDAYFINQSHNPGKLTFVNASFWEKRAAILKLRLLFNSYPPHTISREVSRVSSLILRAKPWLAKKALRHGNRFAARIRRRCFRRKRRDDRKWVCCSQATVHPFVKKLTIRTWPCCQGEVVNCYVTSEIASHYAFKSYLSKVKSVRKSRCCY